MTTRNEAATAMFRYFCIYFINFSPLGASINLNFIIYNLLQKYIETNDKLAEIFVHHKCFKINF